MTLTNEAYLFIDGSETVEFKFESFEVRSAELEKNLLLGGDRGQLLDEFLDWVGISDGADAEGYTVDAGLGSDLYQLRAELTPGDDAEPWGVVTSQNGDTVDNPSGDAVSAHEERPWTRAEVLKYWIRTERLDSVDIRDSGSAELHVGEWTDGTYAGTGKFEEPISVTPLSAEYSAERDGPSKRRMDINLLRSEPFPDFDAVIPDN